MTIAPDFSMWKKAEKRYKDAWVILRMHDPHNIRVIGGEPWLRTDWGFHKTKSPKQIPIPLPDIDDGWDDEPTDPGAMAPPSNWWGAGTKSRGAPIPLPGSQYSDPDDEEEDNEGDQMYDFFFGSGKGKKK